MAIKAIIFDCFGVLVASAETSLYNAFPEYSAKLLELDNQANIGKYTKNQFLQKVSEITGVSINQLMSNNYCNVNDRDRNESAINFARQIKSEGKYKLGMLSNVGSGWLDKFLTENKIKGLFDTTILSCDVKIMKPDPRIFQLIADKMGFKPDECVMIDDRAENIEGAKSIGMRGIVFKTTAQTRAELAEILEK